MSGEKTKEGLIEYFIKNVTESQTETARQLRGLFEKVSDIAANVKYGNDALENMVSRIENIEETGRERFELAMKEIHENKQAISQLGCRVHEEKMAAMQKEIVELQENSKGTRRWLMTVAGIVMGGVILGWFMLKFGLK